MTTPASSAQSAAYWVALVLWVNMAILAFGLHTNINDNEEKLVAICVELKIEEECE